MADWGVDGVVCKGDFETHITVQLPAGWPVSCLQDWAAERQLKCLLIELDGGQHPVQPMLSYRGAGTLAGEHQAAKRHCGLLQAAGFGVSRVKIEAAPWNDGVPQGEVDDSPAGRYFEHHLKLRLGAEPDLAALQACGMPHGARLSRNAWRRNGDGEERFLTQRCPGMGRHAAQRCLDRLVLAVEPLPGVSLLSVEAEYVVFDSNFALDAGWL